ncbi:short-chain dehydrogenase [beta proteobacterium AAP99]|nr:short-chain dehydrogenase [beta proteobacterium AAP99]
MSTASTPASTKIWFITGVSSGLGRELAIKALAAGDRVVGTLRRREQFAAFEALAPGRALAVQADITDAAAVQAAVKSAISTFGRIDVLANNAGYGTVGAVEETSAAEAQTIFDANFFGHLHVIRAVLPQMRAQGSGRIINFSAVGGFTGFPGLGVYSAAKAALDVMTEALAAEVAPFGIKVTVLTLGIFRTEFAGGSLKSTATVMPAYADTAAGKFRGFIGNLAGKQPNDPIKAADAILQLAAAEQPPMHLALGGDAVGVIRKKLAGVEADLQAWSELSTSVAFTA